MKPARLFAACLLVVILTADLLAQERLGPFDHPPRSVRSRAIDVNHIRLELTLDWDQQRIAGRVQHRLAPLRAIRKIELDAREMSIEAVELVHRGERPAEKLAFEQFDDRLVIDLPEQVPAGQDMAIAIDYTVTRPRRGGHFVLPSDHEPDQARSFWTQSEPENARYWFPCFDSPNDRVTSEVLVTVPEGYFVLSNGTLESRATSADGACTWHWIQMQSHVPYLISVVAGEFEAYEQEWDGLPITSYVPKGMAALAERSFQKTPAMMKFFSETIGVRYPWPKYAQICVDEYMWGGMEHTSATTLTLRTLHDERAALDVSSVPLVAHELAHQWWGNLLTCKDWAELWLNESFATYFENLWQEHDEGPEEAAWGRRSDARAYLDEDRERYRRPIVTYRYPTPDSMFDSHSYPKGGLVLHMLRHVLGDEQFFKALNHYAAKHQHRVVETADLRIAIEEATGQGLNWFFEQWIYRGGHPEYEVRWDWDDDERAVRVHVQQAQEIDELTPLFRMPVEIELVAADGKRTVHKVTVANEQETFTFAADRRPRRVLFDPREWVLKELRFKKSKQEWLGQLRDENLMCRVRAVEALEEHTADAQVAAALIRVAKKDPFWGVRQRAAEALGGFTGGDVRAALLHLAENDEKAHVRRAAISALEKFEHEATQAALRRIIKADRSYAAVAAALRTLAKIDPENCREELYAALEIPSHEEQIMRAACESLAELQDAGCKEKLLAVLEPPSPYEKRIAVLGALGTLAGGDAEVTKAIAGQLGDARMHVRRAAIEALGKTGDPAAIKMLREQKEQEQQQRMHRAIDKAIDALRGSGETLEAVRGELDELRRRNVELEDRLRRLEESRK